jgi:hypothetical protein
MEEQRSKESAMSRRGLITACFILIAWAYVTPAVAAVDPATVTAAWLFDEGGGNTINDASGNGSTGTVVGQVEWVGGRFGSALTFEDGEYVDVGPPTPDILKVRQEITIMVWSRPHEVLAHWQVLFSMQRGGSGGEAYAMTYGNNDDQLQAIFNTAGGNGNVQDPEPFVLNEWIHAAATYDGDKVVLYRNGRPVAENAATFSGALNHEDGTGRFAINGNYNSLNGGLREHASCTIDEVLIFDAVLTAEQIQDLMDLGFVGGSQPRTKALRPAPEDGALLLDSWVNLSWSPGDFAVSHNVYLGDNLEDVNAGTGDTFRASQTSTSFLVGFPGYPYPEGLVPGATYYWRIDGVNDLHPESPWKGDIWRFSIAPRTAYNPDPPDGAEFVVVNVKLTWTAGFGAKLHTVHIGEDSETVSNATGGLPQGATSYTPGSLQPEKVYYWRVDEFDGVATHKGDIWAFTTPGAAGNPQPARGATGVQMTAKLNWTPATNATSHQVYFGTDKDAVKNATTASPEYKGSKTQGNETLDPGKLAWHTTYYWRVDAVYSTGTVKGLVWSFTTADFLVVDDFESYNDIDPPDPASNRIFDKWIDGFGTTTNGALVGNDLPPYAEQTIVHSGAQSMPYSYDNNLKTSEATMTLVYPRDWTEEGVGQLSVWFRGDRANAAERMYVALNGSAVVYHDDPAVTQTAIWTEWIIDLQAFQGVSLANVDTITIGFGTKNSPAAGGSGKMYFDDIRLYRP